MDMNKGSGAIDVPAFRVARVGSERRRRGGALAWLRASSPGARGVWGAGAGGSGAAGVNALGMSASKTLLALMATCAIGSASIYAGQRSAANSSASNGEKPKLFAQDRRAINPEGDLSDLPSTSNSIPNSMGYVTGSLDGMTPEERAKAAAEAAAAAEAQRIADEAAAKKAEQTAAKDGAGGSPVDPAALLASAQADGKSNGVFGKRFGQLNTGSGGSVALPGGAGLSGGVGRSFASASTAKPEAGTLGGMRSAGGKPTYTRAARAGAGASKMHGFARQQLASANALSQKGAAAGRSETAAYEAASAFDNNQGAGTAISGTGVGKGASGGAGTPNAVDNGGPLTGGPAPVDCGSNGVPNGAGGCTAIATPASRNATPYQNLIGIAMALMATMAVLAALALIANTTTWLMGLGEMIKSIIRIAMMVIGGVLVALGMAIIAMSGDKMAGGIVAAVGALTLAMAFIPESLGTPGLVVQAAGGLIANIAGMMGAAAARKPLAAAMD